MKTILMKQREFEKLLDLKTKNKVFAKDIYKLYSDYAHCYEQKSYTMLYKYELAIDEQFYEICSKATWSDKNTILSFLKYVKNDCTIQQNAYVSLYAPVPISLVIGLTSSILLQIAAIDVGTPTENIYINLILRLLSFAIIVFFTSIITFAISYSIVNSIKSATGDMKKYIVVMDFLSLCEKSIINHR